MRLIPMGNPPPEKNPLPTGLKALTVEAEQKEILSALKGTRVHLEYLKGSKEKMAWTSKYGMDGRLWNIIAPEGHPLHAYHHSTRSLEGLKELGVISWF